MIKIYLSLIFCLTLGLEYGFAQNQSIKSTDGKKVALLRRSTLASSGQSAEFDINNKTYYYRQSIGQAGVSGTFSAAGYNLRQGFLQPLFGESLENAHKMQLLEARVFPNPFDNFVEIRQYAPAQGELHIRIYNIPGRLVFSAEMEAREQIRLDLAFLPNGYYIIHLRQNAKELRTALIK